jgi:hypothetical protein
MALDVLFVSEEKLKSYTNLNTNLSPADLQPYVWDAQNIMMPHYLGGTYYNALKDRVRSGELTESDEHLLDNFIGPYLCNYGFYLATTFLQFRSYNKGILKGTSENAETLDLDELKFLQSQIKNIAESYAGQMVNHLITHPNEYPLYNQANTKDGELPDRTSPFTANIVVPGLPYASQQRMLRYGNGYPGLGYWANGSYYGADCYNLPGN